MTEKTPVDIQNLREDYRAGKLLVDNIPDNPFNQFEVWFQEAIDAQITEPNAMILGTATQEGRPYTRTVLLKGYDQNGFVFYTNYDSNKGKQLTANPQACITFSWLDLQRQIHIYGRVEKISSALSEQYFHCRPKGSQIGAWASAQSQIIQADRSDLEAKAESLALAYKDAEKLPLPPNWGGYRIVPSEYEFWQGRTSRLHDRIRYKQGQKGSWKIDRLAP